MKKIVTALTGLMLIFLLSACAAPASPQYVNGQYYLMGDENCARYRPLSDTRIECANSQGVSTGYRNAMTPQDIQMYQYQQSRIDAMNRAAMQNTIQRPVSCVTNMGITTCF